MTRLSWWEWLGVVVVACVVAIAVFLALVEIRHWQQDELNVHAMVQLLNYNVAQGKLLALPSPALPPPPEPPK